MKRFMFVMLCLLMFSMASECFARSYSSSRSSFSSSRSSYSYSRPSYSRPVVNRPVVVNRRPVIVNRTTVVNRHYGNSGAGDMALGMMVGNAMSHNDRPQTVVVQGSQPAQYDDQSSVQTVVQPPVVVNHDGFFVWLCKFVLGCTVIGLITLMCIGVYRKYNE